MKKTFLIKKTNWAIIATFISALMVSISCSSDSEDQLPAPQTNDCEGSTASLANDIIPIIQQNCAVAGCHVSGTGRANLSVKDNIISFASQIRTNTQAGVMPPSSSGKSLSDSEKKLINCWVANGAKDN